MNEEPQLKDFQPWSLAKQGAEKRPRGFRPRGGWLLAKAAVLLVALGQDSPAVPPIFDSPDRRCRVEIIEKAMRGVVIEETPNTLLLILNGVVVARHPTLGQLIGVEWSPGGEFVAINNRRRNSGDYLWIFKLPEGRCLKSPDDKHGVRWTTAALLAVKEKNPEASETRLIRTWLTAEGWAGERLLVGIRTRYEGFGYYDCEAEVGIETPRLTLGEVRVSDLEPARSAN